MRRAVCVILTVAAVAVPFATRADARIKKVKTTVTSVTWDDQGSSVASVDVTITSPNPKCIPGRTVRVQTGPSESLQSPYGSGTTDSSGHVHITGSATDTSYYTVYVDKLLVGRTRCKSTAAFGQFSAAPA